MTVFIGLLRAVNVGGTGKLAMTDLKACCLMAGFGNVATYIQSGNLVFSTPLGEVEAIARLEAALSTTMGKAPGVYLRERSEFQDIVSRCPFLDMPGNRVAVYFFQSAFDQSALEHLETPGGEDVVVTGRQVHVYYPAGMGRSKLKLKGLSSGTARNLNTLHKLASMAKAI